MKRTLFLAAFMIAATSLSAQGLTSPSPGKAVVYFVRVTDLGFAIPFEFFHGDKYIGVFAGKKYMRYECDPGEHLFWASSENKEFLTAKLNADAIYVVIVDVNMGIGIARVGLSPIDSQSDLLKRVNKLVNKKAPVVTPEDKIARRNVELADFIKEKLEKYETVWKNEKRFNHLSPHMVIPPSAAASAE